jgi:hypothetical protein
MFQRLLSQVYCRLPSMLYMLNLFILMSWQLAYLQATCMSVMNWLFNLLHCELCLSGLVVLHSTADCESSDPLLHQLRFLGKKLGLLVYVIT